MDSDKLSVKIAKRLGLIVENCGNENPIYDKDVPMKPGYDPLCDFRKNLHLWFMNADGKPIMIPEKVATTNRLVFGPYLNSGRYSRTKKGCIKKHIRWLLSGVHNVECEVRTHKKQIRALMQHREKLLKKIRYYETF